MKDKVKMVKIITIITTIVMFVCIIILSCQFVKLTNFRTQENNLEVEKQALINEIYNYNTANDYYNNSRSEFLEEYARENLTWGANGENWYTGE